LSADLVARLESPLAPSLPAGVPTAVFCCGHCFDPVEGSVAPELLVDGVRHPPAATAMPRPDLGALGPAALHSGFWGTVEVPAQAAGAVVELALAVGDQVVDVGRIEVKAAAPAPTLGRAADAGLIAICMATYEPDPALLEVQLDSLRAQTDRNWVCMISDDASGPERFGHLRAQVQGDERFVLDRSERRLGFYRNFERALRLAPVEAGLIALCDQDDRWHADKLASLRAGLGSAGLVYCDQRLVDAGGRVLRETMWEGRRNNHTNLASMLVANSITGAATLMRREIAELALPFPDTPGLQFHDHWLALVALAAGEIAYVDRPLYDYVQHAGAVFGEVSGGRRRRRARGPLRGGRGAYFLGYVPREVQARVLLARCASRLTRPKRAALERFASADRSPAALAWLAARAARVLAGRTETLAAETELVHGIAWRHAVDLLARAPRGPWRRLCDASFPDPLSFEQKRLRRWRARA
jgi:glycosyltransferase involved in cell wall biosynthesis